MTSFGREALVHLKDFDEERRWPLLAVGLATNYHVVKHVASYEPALVAQVWHDMWVNRAGCVEKAHTDHPYGAFKPIFAVALETDGLVSVCTADQAPRQHGCTERQGGRFKELFPRGVVHQVACGASEIRQAASDAAAAKNSLRCRRGFSPCQWVMGEEPRLLAHLIDGISELAAHQRALDSNGVARRYRTRTAARSAFMHMQNNDVLRRAMLRRARVRQGTQ